MRSFPRAIFLSGLVVAAFGCTAFGCGEILGIPSEVEPARSASEGGLPEGGGDVTQPLDGSTSDVATDSGSDAEPPPILCDITKDFAAPVPLTSLNTAEDDGAARLSEDELTVYVNAVRSADGPSYDIFYAERPDLTDSFGPLKRFPSVDNSIDTANDEYAPNVSDNGLVLIFERKNLATSNSDIYTATRTSKQAPFGPVSSVANLNTADYEANVFIRGDTRELWHVRKDPTIDIFLATLTPGTGYVITKPANINSPDADNSPVITKNGLALYFQSARPIAAGRTDTNVWVATRSSPMAPFNAPVVVANVNSTDNEYPGFISADGCRLYISSRRPGLGGEDMYVAIRPK